jgi:hypothetical protein
VIAGIMQGVHDHEEPLPRVTAAQTPECLADFQQGRAPTEQALETVGMDVAISET